jgi:hypothetical protein
MLGKVDAWCARSPRRRAAIAWHDLRADDFLPRERAALAAHWAWRAREEQVAMVAFEHLGAELTGDPAAATLVRALARIVADEQRHVELCHRVAAALGGSPIREAVARKVRTDARFPARERTAVALTTWVCIGESWSAAVFADGLEGVTHPVLRAVEKEILADEVGHGRLGFAWLFDTWMTLPMSTRLLVEQLLPRALRALEHRQPATRRDLYTATMTRRILPELERAGVHVRRSP